ncbi:ubiquitin hydrolase [Xylariales sp. AK1849]|nr:ubiquitin hydrolase [Xylariales sp. AK1849]
MSSQHLSRQPDRLYTQQNPQSFRTVLFEWLQQPGVLLSGALLLFTAFYQSLHSSPFAHTRHPGELLWDLIVTLIPAWLLYSLDSWLNPPMIPIPKSLRPPQPATYTAKSDLLRKILGMNTPGGLISSVASVGRKGLSTLSSSTLLKRNTQQPAGLGNIDYSCFQNSILQSLSSLKPLPDYLSSATEATEEEGSAERENSSSSLQLLIAQLRDSESNGKTLWTPPKLKSLHTWEQQDAQEYFSKLLDEIDKEAAKAAKSQHKLSGLESATTRDDTEDSQHSDDSGYQSMSTLSKANPEVKIVRNPLEGMAAQRVACVQCGHSEGLSMIPFNCLTLNLGVGTLQHDLYELLDSYTQLESIEGVECAKCTLLKVQRLLKILVNRGKEMGTPDAQLQEPRSRLEAVDLALEEDDFEEKTLKEKCKISSQHRSSSTKTKQAVVARPPRSLAIHMNRSLFDEMTGNKWKNLAAVRFPSTLDLGPWCLGSADESKLCQGSTFQWLSDPKTSMIAGDVYPSKITGPMYELRAVITHQGQHENGHYVCYRKHTRLPPNLEDPASADGNEAEGVDDEKTLADTASNPQVVGDQWWRLSDESVWEVSEEAALAQGGGVFMLFYDCVDPNSVLTSGKLSRKETRKANTDALGSTGALQTPLVSEAEDGAHEGEEVFHDLPLVPELSQGSTQSRDESETALGQYETKGQMVPYESESGNEMALKDAAPASVFGDVPDTFVSSLLSRPNAASTILAKATDRKSPASARAPPGLLSREDVPDSFVSSLLSRPNK